MKEKEEMYAKLFKRIESDNYDFDAYIRIGHTRA